MVAGLRALLAGLIDYAGLFPPSRLPLHEAIRQYAQYRTQPESWMLGRFICPAAQLGELAPFHQELFQSGHPYAFSALGRAATDINELLTGLNADLGDIASFQDRHGPGGTVGVFEVKLPAEVLGLDLAAAGQLFEQLTMRFEDARPALSSFYEAGFAADWRSSLTGLLSAMAAANQQAAVGRTAPWRPAGFKLRCGGPEASSFPTSEQVAFIIAAARDAKIPLKFTAGLHHPIRHFDPDLQTHVHGFLNVFLAGVLAQTLNLAENEIQTIIDDEDPGDFAFDVTGLRWKDRPASKPAIVAARQTAVVSFGSCSFDEPRDRLRQLGWLASA
jgi:hypothetical protein